jgi:hypothetical protein
MKLPTAESLFGKPLDQLEDAEKQILRMTKSICLWRSPHKSMSDYFDNYQDAQDK